MTMSKPPNVESLVAVVAASPAAPAATQPGSGGGAPAGGPPPAMMKALAEHVAALVTQCPVLPPLTAEEASRLPIHITEWGTAGPSVLIIHGGVQGGLGGGPATFAKQEALGHQGWRVRLADRPGFGASPSRGPDDMVPDSVWIAEKLGDSSHLIGHSWGGAESLLAAARRPEAVRSLILVEPALDLLASDDPAFGADPEVRAANMKRFGGWMASKTPAEYGQAFRQSLGAGAASGQESPEHATAIGCAFLRAKMAPVPAFREAVAAVVKARIPVLVISGGWSPSFEKADDVIARMLNARRVVVSSPNHFVQLSNPSEFNKVVSDFMHQAEQAHGAH